MLRIEQRISRDSNPGRIKGSEIKDIVYVYSISALCVGVIVLPVGRVADPGSASVTVMTGVSISYHQPDTGFAVITLLRSSFGEGVCGNRVYRMYGP
jgi:hypothetical protein